MAVTGRVRDISTIKSKLMKPAQTSIYEVDFTVSTELKNYLAQRGMIYESFQDLINLSCSEASLPGSSIATSEHPDKYHGSTHRYGYRRQYDDRADFTFYVDAPKNGGPGYNVIWFFEQWISYIVGEDNLRNQSEESYSYRVNYPDAYRSDIFITKFEKDANLSTLRSRGLKGEETQDQNAGLSYRFVKAFPISITSMPVSYEQSQILKCTVSFTYIRYVATRNSKSISADGTSMKRQATSNSNVGNNFTIDNQIGDFPTPQTFNLA